MGWREKFSPPALRLGSVDPCPRVAVLYEYLGNTTSVDSQGQTMRSNV